MQEKYLVVNCGSSSLKFSLYEMPSEKELINGYIEKIGLEDSFWTIKINGEKFQDKKYLANHSEAVEVMLDELFKNKVISSVDEIVGIGHRVLHGGEFYHDSVEIDSLVLERIESLTKLGPLHHPGEIAGIKAMIEKIPHAKEVAVFDTAFHQTMPKRNYIYAIPYEMYEKHGYNTHIQKLRRSIMFQIEKTTLIAEIMENAPYVAPMFQAIGMHCMGCAMASGENVEEACAAHGVDVDKFVEKVNEFIAAQG